MSMFDAINNNQLDTAGVGYNSGLGGLSFGNSGFSPQAGLIGNQSLGGGQFGFNSFGGLSDSTMSGLQMGQLGIGALTGLANGYMGLQNASLARKQASQAQANWDKQWNANVQTTNASLADRQKARVASNPNAYESVDSYLKKYGIS